MSAAKGTPDQDLQLPIYGSLLGRKMVVPSTRTGYIAVDQFLFFELMARRLVDVPVDDAWYLATYPDIREAIAATNANLPRVRPERFLFEAGQQRAIRDILAVPLAHGYSIAIVDRDAGTGVFQPADQINSLGRQNSIVIRSPDLNTAFRLEPDSICLDTQETLLASLENPQVLGIISRGKWATAELAKDLFGQPVTDPSRARVQLTDGRSRAYVIQIFESSQVPFDRLSTALGDKRVAYGLVLLKLTKRHLAAVTIKKRNGVVSEESRALFAIPEAVTATTTGRS